jgi:alpha-beta hydrolase superfamily lysophospholipase
VLLLHGMSDSPYSLRSIGEALHQRGSYVIGMRVPGHGQAPSGLLDVQWQDMAAAVKLAITELREKSGDMPLYIVGYSNGGALAVQYALDTLADSTLVPVDGLVLISPEIGIAKIAAMSKWLERLGHLLGLEKLAWNGLQPEYDPWKYGSFALNAGKQAYRITQQIQRQINAQTRAATLDRMPPILAFQSVVDATVTAPDLVRNLFDRLPATVNGAGSVGTIPHELVLFDLNRHVDVEVLMHRDPSLWIDPMRGNQNLDFTVTLLTNQNEQDQSVVSATQYPGVELADVCDTGLAWPGDVYSLAHVSLPFPPDDPIYGRTASGPGLHLGNIALRGEKSVLQLAAADMLRLRYNPFYAYLEQRALIFMGLDAPAGSPCVKRGFTPHM